MYSAFAGVREKREREGESNYLASIFLMLLAMIVGAGGGGTVMWCAGVVGMMGVLTSCWGWYGVRVLWGSGSGDTTGFFGGRPRFGVVPVAAPRARRAGGGGVLTGSGSLGLGSASSAFAAPRLRLLRGWMPLSSISSGLFFVCLRVLYARARRPGDVLLSEGETAWKVISFGGGVKSSSALSSSGVAEY